MENPSDPDLQAHYGQLIASVDDYAIFTLDRAGTILDWNKGAERMKGYSPSEIVGKNFSIFYTKEDLAAGLPSKELETALAEGRYYGEGWRLRKDGGPIWAGVTITALTATDPKGINFLKITRDLTERTQAMETLRQSEERFRMLLENVHEYAIFMLDPEGHVMTWNLGARRIKGYAPEEIIGKHFSAFYPPEAVVADVPDTFLRKATREGSAEHEGWRLRRDGSRFWGQVVLNALHDSKGELRGFAKITRDLTHRKEFLELQEAARRKDIFLTTLSHELRNPLAPMLPALEMIQKAAGGNEQVIDMARILERQVDQMAFLINDLLDVSRITTGKIVLKKSRARVSEIITRAIDAVHPLMEEARHTLHIDMPGEEIEVVADGHRITQVITNLLSNASRYTDPAGVITITASVERNPILKVSVIDNGRGVPIELQDRIFDLFDQGSAGSEEGLGIGLTVAKTLVEMHGGSILLESGGAGQGSKFTIYLPIVVDVDPDASMPTHRVQAEKKKCERILVADDGKNAADIVTMFFRMEGIETVTAYDGVEAVEKAATFLPDLVLMDLGMPRMNGYEAARLIRRQAPGALIVALSGWGAEEDRRRSSEAGFDVHMVKPVAPAELRALVAQHFTAGAQKS